MRPALEALYALRDDARDPLERVAIAHAIDELERAFAQVDALRGARSEDAASEPVEVARQIAVGARA